MWNNILRSSLTYKMNEEPFVNLCENILDLENKGALIERDEEREREREPLPPHLTKKNVEIMMVQCNSL